MKRKTLIEFVQQLKLNVLYQLTPFQNLIKVYYCAKRVIELRSQKRQINL